MMRHLTEIAPIMGAELFGEDASFQRVSTDTRTLEPGQLFIALQGPNFDGHQFIKQAEAKNAVAAIVQQPVDANIPLLKVNDTLKAFGALAAYHRAQHNPTILAITGSCGKTTTKTMLASILSQVGLTHVNPGNFNNAIGVPHTLLGLTKEHQFAVVEMGANNPGEIAYLCELAKPKVTAITLVAPSHLLGFGSIDGVAKAKGEIYSGLAADGIAVMNLDEPWVNEWKQNLKQQKIITFARHNDADFTAKEISLNNQCQASFIMRTPLGDVDIQLPLVGEHHISNALTAAACAYSVGVDLSAIKQGLASVENIDKRMVRHELPNNIVVLDDTYNANPLSFAAALDVLKKIPGKRIVVMADMGELGSGAPAYHRDVGAKAHAIGVDQLHAWGELSQLAVDAFGEGGHFYQDKQDLINAVQNELTPNTTVLVKASRSMKMEEVVKALLTTARG